MSSLIFSDSTLTSVSSLSTSVGSHYHHNNTHSKIHLRKRPRAYLHHLVIITVTAPVLPPVALLPPKNASSLAPTTTSKVMLVVQNRLLRTPKSDLERAKMCGTNYWNGRDLQRRERTGYGTCNVDWYSTDCLDAVLYIHDCMSSRSTCPWWKCLKVDSTWRECISVWWVGISWTTSTQIMVCVERLNADYWI